MKKILVLIILLSIVFAYDDDNGTLNYWRCYDATDCVAALNDNGHNEVRLQNDIINHSGTCITFPANNKTFDGQGYTIDGIGVGSGIHLEGKSGNVIKNCVINGFAGGITLLFSSNNNQIFDNIIQYNYHGILMTFSSDNQLNWNVTNENAHGIHLWDSSNNILTYNTAINNSQHGIIIGSSSNENDISHNTMKNNISNGIYLSNSWNNTLYSNIVKHSDYGIQLFQSSNNNLTSNVISKSSFGVYLWNYSDHNSMNSNGVCNNIGTDIVIDNTCFGNQGDYNAFCTADNYFDVGQNVSHPNTNACPLGCDVGFVHLQLDKTVDNSSPKEGETITYKIILKNDGFDTGRNIKVNDIIPAGLTYAGIITGGNSHDTSDPAGVGLTWTINSLEKNESVDLTFQATVNGGITGNNIINYAQISTCDQIDLYSDYGNGPQNPDEDDDDTAVIDVLLAVEHTSIIDEFMVLPAYPNPFNPSVTIEYNIPNESNVNIAIYDITGKLITIFQIEKQTPGWHSVIWNGTNQHSEQVPAGLYLTKITSGSEVKTFKLTLLK